MVSPWSREYAETHGEWSAETVAGGPEPSAAETTAPEKADPPPAPAISPPAQQPAQPSDDRGARRPGAVPVIAVAAAGGLVAAAVVIGVLRGDDGDSDQAEASSTFDTLEGVDAVTTLPALPATTLGTPIATVPEAVLVGSSFATVPGVEAADLIAYDLAAAAETNASVEQPMRTMYKISGLVGAGDRPTIVSITAAYDPRAQRDSLTVTSGESTSSTITDRISGSVFRSSPALPPGAWAQFTETDVLAGSDAGDLATLFDAFAVGPITPELLAMAKVRAEDGLVRLGDDRIARRFDVIVDRGAISPWGAMSFVAAPEAVVTDRWGNEAITFEVYVTSEPAIALVTSQFQVDGEARGLSQFFERRPAGVRIEVPDASAVIGGGT